MATLLAAVLAAVLAGALTGALTGAFAGGLAGAFLATVFVAAFAVAWGAALTAFGSALASAFAPGYAVLVIARFIGGLAFASLSVAPMYIGEIAPRGKRGMLISVNQLNIMVGFSVAYFANYFVLQASQSDAAWAQALGLDRHAWHASHDVDDRIYDSWMQSSPPGRQPIFPTDPQAGLNIFFAQSNALYIQVYVPEEKEVKSGGMTTGKQIP